MNLDELRSAQAKERRKDSLQHLRDAFYDDVAGYVADLRAARDRRAEQVEKPFSDDDVRRMSDEIETAEEVAEALYERRVGKVVKLASFAAADMSVETDGMTTQERALFDDLVARIRANKSAVLAALAGEEPPVSQGESPASTSAGDDSAGEQAGSGRPTPDEPEESNASTAPAPDDQEAGADVLAGAMGGESSDPPDPNSAPPDPNSAPPDRPDSDPSAVPDASGDSAPPADRDETADRTPSDRSGSVTADGGATPVEPGPAPPGTSDGPSADEAATDGPPADPPADEEQSDREAGVDRETVRITRDVGAIFGVDEREYDLASEDVVTLPTENAEPLVSRDAAERIE